MVVQSSCLPLCVPLLWQQNCLYIQSCTDKFKLKAVCLSNKPEEHDELYKAKSVERTALLRTVTYKNENGPLNLPAVDMSIVISMERTP